MEDICDFTATTQPIRSSWAGGADPTGLADIHPVTGTPVLDEFDCGSPATPGAGGDDFTRMLDVLEGEIYVILLDDYGNTIVNGGISIDFTSTTPGVLDAPDDLITVTSDTTVCAGTAVQLEATGGLVYQWNPPATLSCANCPDPVASPEETTSYQVQIATTCNTYNKVVNVKVFDLDLGPDITVCNNAEFKLNPHPFDGVQYNWIGDNLSCYDCPTPTVTGLSTGNYEYYVSMITPFCTLYDTLHIQVVSGEAPQYVIASDQAVCEGSGASIGGPAQAGTSYNWYSVPPGFSSAAANPIAMPGETTTYYLEASNQSCPFSSLDSVTVTVYELPLLDVIPNTTICQGDQIQLGNTAP
ncbi:MAG: hypothetical protein KC496_22665, partial [Anaerolineae bacterium]|nr:hypothetical protein [Anaerolineae bacterium]